MGYLHSCGLNGGSTPEQTCPVCGASFRSEQEGECPSCFLKKQGESAEESADLHKGFDSFAEKEYHELCCAATSGTVMLHMMGEDDEVIALPTFKEFCNISRSGYRDCSAIPVKENEIAH